MTYSIIDETGGKDIGQLWYLVAYSAKTSQGIKINSVIFGADISTRSQAFNLERLRDVAHQIKSKVEGDVDVSKDIQILSISYLCEGYRSQLEAGTY